MSKYTLWAAISAAACVALTMGCGGGSLFGDDVDTKVLPGIAALDGHITDDGIVVTSGGAPCVGDFDFFMWGRDVRQCFTFDPSAIPAGAEILSATLRVFQANSVGNPFNELGNVVVDYVDLGPFLDPGDYNSAPISDDFAVLSVNGISMLRTADVTDQVQDAVNAGRPPQFRLQFDWVFRLPDVTNDYAHFVDTEDSIGSGAPRPSIEVTYKH